MHCDGAGLWLQVTMGRDGFRRRSWVLRYRSPVTGKDRSMGLGGYPATGLAEARAAAAAARAVVL